MQKIDFPLTGNLRPGDVLRTVYPDRDECIVRNMTSAEGRNIFEIALDDYQPYCIQELWNIEGSGAFVHRDWRDGINLPNLVVVYDGATNNRRYYLTSQDSTKREELDDGRQQVIFEKLLGSSHYRPMGVSEYNEWKKDYGIWYRANAAS